MSFYYTDRTKMTDGAVDNIVVFERMILYVQVELKLIMINLFKLPS